MDFKGLVCLKEQKSIPFLDVSQVLLTSSGQLAPLWQRWCDANWFLNNIPSPAITDIITIKYVRPCDVQVGGGLWEHDITNFVLNCFNEEIICDLFRFKKLSLMWSMNRSKYIWWLTFPSIFHYAMLSICPYLACHVWCDRCQPRLTWLTGQGPVTGAQSSRIRTQDVWQMKSFA